MRILAFLLAVLAGLVPAPAAADVRVTSRTYDLLDRLETETVALEDGGSATVRYTYYNDGRRRTLTDAFGRVTFYEYDGRGNLKRVTANQGLPDQHVTSYEYWPDDLLRTITKPNGTVTSYEYDRADRLTSVVVRLDAAVLASFAYTYDANGNRLTQVETNGSGPETTSYTYDALNRLETVTYPDGSSAAYSYDAVGNRVREVSRDSVGAIVSDKTASFDSINRLTSLADAVDPSGSATLTWDRNGNLLSKATPAGTESYGYDAADHLVETRSGSSITARFAFDPFGRRHLKVGTDSRQYLYDETSTLHELDSDDLEVAKYEYGGDRLLSFVRRDEARRFYHLDGLGSPAALSDSGGSVVARYHLDAWGRYRVPSELSLSANRFGFTGYLFDQETDLYYAKARFYDPELGRFTTQDSVLGEVDEPPSLNRYAYAYARPTVMIDPTGHIAFLKNIQERLDRTRQNLIESTADFSAAFSRNTGIKTRIVDQKIADVTGSLAGLAGTASGVVGSANFAVNLAVMREPGSSLGQEATAELIQTWESVKNAATTIAEDPSGVAMRIVDAGKEKALAALQGDPTAMAEVSALGTEIAVDLVVGAKGATTALGATRQLADASGDAAQGLMRHLDDLPPLPRVGGGSQGADILDGIVPRSGTLSNDVALAFHEGASTLSPKLIHDDYVRWVRGPGAKEGVFETPWTGKHGSGVRKVDDFDAATGTIFEGNTTPWQSMTRDKLSHKLDQATADYMLLQVDPRVRRAIWFGTEALPDRGRGAVLKHHLQELGIPYWVVKPY
jgi:RHS repeat-associated protein